jgi:hypothetical protein
MIALGNPSHRTATSGPILGRSFIQPLERTLMAKLSKWIGLTDRPHGIYIRPHEAGGYTCGRWTKQPLGMGYRFEHIGQAATVEACREALEVADKAIERRTMLLNKRTSKRSG